MKRGRHIALRLAAALLAVLVTAGGALAASFSGRSSTEVEWFDTGEGETAVPIYQYLLLNGRNLDGAGLSFHLYGRLAEDLADEADIDSRLYTAYFEKKGLLEGLDLRLGRQFIATTAGASVMDGLTLDYAGLGPLKLTLFGGGDVAYYESYSAKDLIDGIEVSGTFAGIDAGLSYLQRWDESELAQELVGLDLDTTVAQALNLYSETQLNVLTESVSYFSLGGKYFADPRWSLRAEYLYSLPVFSSTSIYSVFAVAEYQELMAELDYKIDTGLKAFGRYSRELYDEFDDADVFEAGIEKIRTDRLSGYLVGTLRYDEEGQDLSGVKARLAYLFTPAFTGALGMHLDVLERRLDDDEDETTSSRVWVDGTATLSKTVNLQAKLERIESDLWDEYYRGRVRLNIRF